MAAFWNDGGVATTCAPEKPHAHPTPSNIYTCPQAFHCTNWPKVLNLNTKEPKLKISRLILIIFIFLFHLILQMKKKKKNLPYIWTRKVGYIRKEVRLRTQHLSSIIVEIISVSINHINIIINVMKRER